MKRPQLVIVSAALILALLVVVAAMGLPFPA